MLRYEKTSERLAALLSYLKTQGNISEEQGLYQLKSVELPRARRYWGYRSCNPLVDAHNTQLKDQRQW
jgi:hypothetical protein